MARTIPNVDVTIDTFDTWVNRTNSILNSLATEVVTANSTLGVTGSPSTPVNSRLWGTFTANTLTAATQLVVPGVFSANTSRIVVDRGLQANGSLGIAGQFLTSNGSGIYWSSSSGIGTVTRIDTLNEGGLIGGPITSTGILSVRAGTGISVGATGVSVNTAWLAEQGSSNSIALQGRTWEAPGAIGSQTANTGSFTSLSVNTTFNVNTHFTVSSTTVRTSGFLDGTTPSAGSTGGVRVRANSSNLARLEFTNGLGSSQYAVASINATGLLTYTGDMRILNDIEVGYRNIPQVIATLSTINTTINGGKHLYLPSTAPTGISLTLPNSSEYPCPIGTAITIVNGSTTVNISLLQGVGSVIQLAGTSSTGNRVIGPGGLATLLKVENDKWFVSGVGVS